MSTLLPFLYQTRTLQRLSRTGISPRTFRALLHSSSRTHTPRDRARPQRSRDDDIPFELPEGYENPDDKFRPREDAELGAARSTITTSEQEVFSRIFAEIATRTKTNPPSAEQPARPSPEDLLETTPAEPAAAPPPPPPPSFDAADDFGVRTSQPNAESIRNTINIIVQDASEVQTNSRRRVQKPFDPLHPLEQTSAATDWERALLRFPPRLREAAQMALGVMEQDEAAQKFNATSISPEEIMNPETSAATQIDLILDPLSKTVQNEALRREERNRVEAKMRAAQTDFELWDVLEAEVFPMVHKLGIDEDPSPRRRGAAKRDRKNKLPLHIYGPLYPTYLLSALRLLDTHFARSSPLALHLLPRVRELGPASYVLGVSTPFYNEMARLLWNRYGDPAAVFNLLEEMRVAGLYCDEGTRAVVHRIEQFFASVAQGKWGPFLRELASLPEYQFALLPRMRYWLGTIHSHIVERSGELQE